MERYPENQPSSRNTEISSNNIDSLNDLLSRGVTPILKYEYDQIRARIALSQEPEEKKKLEYFLSNSKIVENPSSTQESISLGSQVTLEYAYLDEAPEQEVFIITGSDIGPYEQISTAQITTPIAKLLIGHKVDETVLLQLGDSNSVKVKILGIEQINLVDPAI